MQKSEKKMEEEEKNKDDDKRKEKENRYNVERPYNFKMKQRREETDMMKDNAALKERK